MNKWDENKLEEMTKTQNEFTHTKIDYTKLARKYPEIIEKTYKNGDVVPLAFKDVEVTYNGKIEDDIELPKISNQLQEEMTEKEKHRQTMHIKHFSRSISHQEWFNFLDEEVNIFIEKYPEYHEIIL